MSFKDLLGCNPDVQFDLDASSGVATIRLSSGLAAEIASRLARDEHPADRRTHRYVQQLRWAAYRHFPPQLLALLEAVRDGSLAPTCLVIEGLPHENVPRAPAPWQVARAAKSSDLSENILVAVASLLGEPYAVVGESARLVNDLVPTLQDRHKLTGNGSDVELGLHTENAAYRWALPGCDLSPHGLLLGGVVTPECNGPATTVSNGRKAAARLSLADYEILRSRCVRFAFPLRHRRGGAPVTTAAQPVLTGRIGRETVTAAFYGDMMVPCSAQAERALQSFRDRLIEGAVHLHVVPGTMVFIPNTYTLHGRGSFAAEFDEQERANRWVQRVFVTARLDAFQAGVEAGERFFELPQNVAAD